MRARVLGLVVCLVGAAAAFAAPAAAQSRVRELEVNVGVSAEAYRGNLTAATAPVVDSTERADAAVGEVGARGSVALLESEKSWLFLNFDAGLRQFAAAGFVVRDYAPREWVGQGSLSYGQLLGQWGTATARAGWRGRSVKDRPPMPLFLQPGFGIATASLRLDLTEIERVRFDVLADAEWANYSATRLSRQLDLLDRRGQGLEVGATWGDRALVRVFGSYRQSRYANQLTFDPEDPFRRDRTMQGGFSWSLESSATIELGLEGTVNRSNSLRPEYDAVSARALVSVPLPYEIGATMLGVITGKSYVNQSEFKVLVPGEEADNASVLYLDLARPLALGLDASLRLGWTRAEAEVGNAYFQRFGASVLLRYRPGGF